MALEIKNKIGFITGASSGIGEATAIELAKLGVNLILTARRFEKIENLANMLINKYGIKALPLQLDIKDKDAVLKTIDNLNNEWKNIDILINNAGMALDSATIQDGSLNSWDAMIDTNVRGLLYVSHAILPSMVSRNSGHIVNIGSIAGRDYYMTGNIYSATKHAVKAISKSMHIDLLGKAVRVSEVAPGAVHTEFSEVRWNDKDRSDKLYKTFDALQSEDIADAVAYCVTRPLHVDISEIVVLPTVQASCNHVHKIGSENKSLFD